MYLFLITILLCVTYVVLYFLFPYFFKNTFIRISKKSLISIGIIFFSSPAGYAIALNIPNVELSNRITHGFGGGFLAFMTCFLAVKDSKLGITKFQFFVFSLLLVSTLGIGNEILEFILQNTTDTVYAPHINDTWYDLISNLVGTLIAAALFVAFVNNKR